MQRFSQPSPKTFNLLSIGQRGVGKTVFLAGSYAQLQMNSSNVAVKSALVSGSAAPDPERAFSAFWFECQDETMQANLVKILHYVEQTGLYPPATIKVTDFNFQLKQRTSRASETVCQFRWWDTPGEVCNLRHDEFQQLVLTSHACCVFINAHALIHDPSYMPMLQDSLNQVMAIASLAQQHQLKYAIALILTQCDLLKPGEITQIKAQLQPVIGRLSDFKVNHRLFYSAIPIETTDGHFKLNAKGAADSLLWLLTELNKHYRFQPERNLTSHLSQNRVKRRFPPRLERLIVVLTITGISLLGVGILLKLGLNSSNAPPKLSPAQEQRSP